MNKYLYIDSFVPTSSKQISPLHTNSKNGAIVGLHRFQKHIISPYLIMINVFTDEFLLQGKHAPKQIDFVLKEGKLPKMSTEWNKKYHSTVQPKCAYWLNFQSQKIYSTKWFKDFYKCCFIRLHLCRTGIQRIHKAQRFMKSMHIFKHKTNTNKNDWYVHL